MTNNEAQELAPSYLHLPYDGAMHRCSVCHGQKTCKDMILPFTPNKIRQQALCLLCVDEEWLNRAMDCGEVTLTNE